jgi:GDP-4-dehydro-6-deoxy-D-mannose reductase
VRAYRLIASAETAAEPGIYNVSSGISVSAADQVRLLGELLAPIEVIHEIDPARVRASEVMDLRGDHSRLTAATGWEPEIPLRQTVEDTIGWWERQLGAPAGG